MFIRFGGIDYDADPDAADALDDFICRAQEALTQYGGNLLGLTIGDKGAYLYAVFGVPNAHEDDAARACRAALEVLELANTALLMVMWVMPLFEGLVVRGVGRG